MDCGPFWYRGMSSKSSSLTFQAQQGLELESELASPSPFFGAFNEMSQVKAAIFEQVANSYRPPPPPPLRPRVKYLPPV